MPAFSTNFCFLIQSRFRIAFQDFILFCDTKVTALRTTSIGFTLRHYAPSDAIWDIFFLEIPYVLRETRGVAFTDVIKRLFVVRVTHFEFGGTDADVFHRCHSAILLDGGFINHILLSAIACAFHGTIAPAVAWWGFWLGFIFAADCLIMGGNDGAHAR